MIFPPERIAEVCALGPVKAAELLDRGRAGDLQALGDWSVRALYRKFISIGASPVEARKHVQNVLGKTNLSAKVVA